MQFVACLSAGPTITHFLLFLTAADPFVYGFFIKSPNSPDPDGRDLPLCRILADGYFM